MSVAVVYPPLLDFTVPPETLACHKAALRQAKIDNVVIDYNYRACLDALSRERLVDWCTQIEARVAALVRRPNLTYWEQGELRALIAALPDGIAAQENVGDALDIWKSERFFIRDQYGAAQRTWSAIQQVVSALSFPFELSLTSVTAPFMPWSEAAAGRFAAVHPFKVQEDKLLQELKHQHIKALVIIVDEPTQFPFAMALAGKAREVLPDARLIVTGQLVAATAHKEVWLKRFDAVVTTASEEVLPTLVKGLLAAKPKAAAGALLASTVTATAAKGAAPVLSVEELQTPDYGDITIADYPNPVPAIAFRPCRGRGNQFSTAQFKGLDGAAGEMRKWLAPAQAAEQIEALWTQHSLGLVQLTCEPASVEWLLELADYLTSHASTVRFSAWVGLDGALLVPAAAERLRAAGCVSLVFATSDNREAGAEQNAMFAQLSRSVEAAAHAGIAVQLAVAFGLPGLTEDYSREIVNLGRAHGQEIDVINVNEASRVPWRRSFLPESAPSAFVYAGDELGLQPDGAALWASALRERIVPELSKMSSSANQMHPFAGAAGAAHTALFFDKQGRKALQGGIRMTGGAYGRSLSEGDRVKLSPAAKLLWIPYQLSVSQEIAHEEVDLREMELRRRARDLSADKVWAYSQRVDLTLRAGPRTPHLIAPGMPLTELSVGAAEMLGQIQEQFVPVSQLVSRAAREGRDALKRQLTQLNGSGALLTEYQARREGEPAPQQQRHASNNGGGGQFNPGNGGGGGGGGQPGGQPGNGRKRRRRRRGGGGGGGGGQRFSGPMVPQ